MLFIAGNSGLAVQASCAIEGLFTPVRVRGLQYVDADLTLHPNFGYYVSASREFRQRAIRAGYEQTMAQAASVKALHA